MTAIDRGVTTYGGVSPDTGKAPAKIAGMFDAIAGRYDLLNHVLSGGQDLYWRWRAVRRLRLTGKKQVLDLCTGTCDVARTMVRRGLARRGRRARIRALLNPRPLFPAGVSGRRRRPGSPSAG